MSALPDDRAHPRSPAQPDPGHPDPGHPDPVHPDPVHPDPVHADAGGHEHRPPDTRIRSATPDDVPTLVTLVRDLAEYEHEGEAVEATDDHFMTALFPSDPSTARSHALVAEVLGPSGPLVVGMAVWYVTFSTWTGRHGIWLEDLFVRPEHRGSGLGKGLLRELASIAVDRGYRRVEWWVLRWNQPSLDFYAALDARPMDEWVHYRLDGAALRDLGHRSDVPSASTTGDPIPSTMDSDA